MSRGSLGKTEKTLTEKKRPGATYNKTTGLFEGPNADAVNAETKLIRQKLQDYKGFIGQVEEDAEEKEKQIKAMNEMTKYYDIKKQEADTGGITDNIILPMKKPTKTEQLITQLDQSSSNILSDIDKMKKQTDRATETLDKATAPAKIPAAQAAANREDRRSSQYTSPSPPSKTTTKSTSRSSRPGGSSSWGRTFHGANGGIVDLL